MVSGDLLADPPDSADTLRISMCQAVLRWVIGNVEGWTSEQDLDGGDLILITLFVRASRTYEGVVRWLGQHSFGEQGLMLNRSLFEDMIDAHWVALNKELAIERLEQHDLSSRLLRAETQRKFPRIFDNEPPPKIRVSNEERRTLRALYGKGGSGSWTGVRNLDQRVAEVKGFWPEGEEQELLLWWTAWVHKISNEMLHPSALSLGRLGTPEVDEDGTMQWHFGATRNLLSRALQGALWTYGQIVGLVVDTYSPDARTDFVQLWGNAMAAFPEATRMEETLRVGTDPETQEPPST
jgi:hypothetical protein